MNFGMVFLLLILMFAFIFIFIFISTSYPDLLFYNPAPEIIDVGMNNNKYHHKGSGHVKKYIEIDEDEDGECVAPTTAAHGCGVRTTANAGSRCAVPTTASAGAGCAVPTTASAGAGAGCAVPTTASANAGAGCAVPTAGPIFTTPTTITTAGFTTPSRS